MRESAAGFVRRVRAGGIRPEHLRELARRSGFYVRRVRLRGGRPFAPTVTFGCGEDAFEVAERLPGEVRSLRALLLGALAREKSTVAFLAAAGMAAVWASARMAAHPGAGPAAAIVLLELLRAGAGLRLSGRLSAALVPGVWGRVLQAGLAWFHTATPEQIALAGRSLDPVCTALACEAFEFAAAAGSAVAVGLVMAEACGRSGLATAFAALALALARGILRCLEASAAEASEATERSVAGTAWLIVLDILNLRLLRSAERLAARYLAAHRAAVAGRDRERALHTKRCALAAATPAVLLLPAAVLRGAVLRGADHSGPAASYLAGVALLAWSLHLIDRHSRGLFRIAFAARRLNPLLTAETEPEAPEKRALRPRGAIRFDGVTFAWPGSRAPALDDISISIEPGEFVCFAGPSGSGKSTLIRLILGLESPTRGDIFFDGQPLRSLDIETVRSAIESISQDERLADGTVRSNILGASSASLAEAWAAARLACIDDAIRAMPLGMMTFAGERAFSGAERRRLFIARALVSRPAILILDETLSGFDEEMQCRVIAHLRTIPGLTCIVASHRPSLAAIMDRTWRFERGRIVGVETGRAVRAAIAAETPPPAEHPIFLPEAVERFHAPEPLDRIVRLWPC